MAGSSSDAIMDGPGNLDVGGNPQHFVLSPRLEETGGGTSARRTLYVK